MTNENGGRLDPITAAWTGREPLWKVFWIYHWAAGMVVNVVATALALWLPKPLSLVVFVPVVAWGVWVTVAQWRCAFNTNWRGWGYLMRLYVVASLLLAGGVIWAVFHADELFRLPR